MIPVLSVVNFLTSIANAVCAIYLISNGSIGGLFNFVVALFCGVLASQIAIIQQRSEQCDRTW